MTENEAIKILDTEKHCLDKSTKGLCKINCGDCKANIPIVYQEKAYELAIFALKEIQQYRAIGTVEEFRDAAEKQKPVEIIRIAGKYPYKCPTCNGKLELGYRYCIKCGQLLKYPYDQIEDFEGIEDE